MRALFLQHDHLSPPGPVAERFAHRGYAITETSVVAPEDFHAPNEFFRVHRLHEGLEAWARYWHILGEATS